MGVALLYDLQQLDSAIDRTTAHRSGLNDGSPERAVVTESAARLDDLRRQLAARQSRIRTLELEIQSVQAKRAKAEADLYSGRVRNPKELTAMQDELGQFDRMRASLEDEVLTLLDEVERLQPQEREAAQRLESATAALSRQEEAYRLTAEADDRQLADLTEQRAALIPRLEEDLLRRYERLRERKGGIAVVVVHSGVCDGCHMTIPEGLRRRLEEEPETLAACDGCGRILFVPPRG